MSSRTKPSASRTPLRQTDPATTLRHLHDGAVLLDVRSPAERSCGMPEGALGLDLDALADGVATLVPDLDCEVFAICALGQRSVQAVERLRELGYRRVASVAGGFARWQAEGLPTCRDERLDGDMAERYARQLRLPEIGADGQHKLARARVAMLGAGGLGAPAALYLAAAGVGQLTLIDDDRVERSNLHRQVIHADARVGMAKTASAALTLQALNPRVHIEQRPERLVAANVERLLSGHDVILDGADNFSARFLLSAASLRLRIPMVYGAIERFRGQVSVFDPRREDSPCYRCLFPEPPATGQAPNCSEAGVLGVLPGLVGMLQACETLKLILALGDTLTGRLLTVDALGMRFRELRLPRNPACPACASQARFDGYRDLDGACT